jgi:hypothetical protein
VPSAFVRVHGTLSAVLASSSSPSQSLSLPSQSSSVGVLALQPVNAVPLQVSKPGHAPKAFDVVHERTVPTLSGEQSHVPLVGRQ